MNRQASFILALATLTSSLYAQDKVTYADHARAIMENKCFSCHNPDKKKGDLDLTSFAGVMTGGGGGAIVDLDGFVVARSFHVFADEQLRRIGAAVPAWLNATRIGVGCCGRGQRVIRAAAEHEQRECERGRNDRSGAIGNQRHKIGC